MPKVKSKKPKRSTPCPICGIPRAAHLRVGHLRTNHGEIAEHHGTIIAAWKMGTTLKLPKAQGIIENNVPDQSSLNGSHLTSARLADLRRALIEAEEVLAKRREEYAAALEEEARAVRAI